MTTDIFTPFKELSINKDQEIKIITTLDNTLLEYEDNIFAIINFKNNSQMFYWNEDNGRWKPCDGIKLILEDGKLHEVIDDISDKLTYLKISYTLGGYFWCSQDSQIFKKKLKVDEDRGNILSLFLKRKSNPKEINLYCGFSISKNFDKKGTKEHITKNSCYNNNGILYIPFKKNIKHGKYNSYEIS